jgi:hypothetical protein
MPDHDNAIIAAALKAALSPDYDYDGRVAYDLTELRRALMDGGYLVHDDDGNATPTDLGADMLNLHAPASRKP